MLRETGISITHPVIDGVSGEGMEYHSDGSLGENTVLLSLFDIDPNQGGLKVFPGIQLTFLLRILSQLGHAKYYSWRRQSFRLRRDKWNWTRKYQRKSVKIFTK